jgi:hypothetical protein
MNTYPVDITVYADSQKNTVLHKDTTFQPIEVIQRFRNSNAEFYDDDKWWERIVFGIEKKFDGNWYCIEVVTSDRKFGRVLNRDHCVLGLEPKNDFVWMNKLFLFGEHPWENIGETFSGSIIFSTELNKIHTNQYYRYGSDENVVAMIKDIAESDLFDCNVVDVVINPAVSSILAMSLVNHYKLMLSIPTKIKVDRLMQIYQSMNICTDISNELYNQIRLVKFNKIPELAFLDKALDQVQFLLDTQSEHSLFSTLKNEFKPNFDF